MSREWMGDPYAAQLRAANAEGELARIKDALREFAEDNGLNPEMEPRDLLAKATGAFRSCAAMSGLRYEEIQELKAEMEAMRPRLMPEGMAWPRYEDGEPVMLNDVALLANGLQEEVYQVHFHGSGFALYTETSDVDYSYGERVKRPAVLAADGEPLEVGQTVYDVGAEADTPLAVVEVSSDLVWCEYTWKDGKTYRPCYPPDQLTHQRPVLDADGVPIKVGDRVWNVAGGGPYKITRVNAENAEYTYNDNCGPMDWGASPKELTHKEPRAKPEQDSWERIEADCMQDAKDYCEEHGIEPEYPKHSGKAKCEDLVRRCKNLAGVSE